VEEVVEEQGSTSRRPPQFLTITTHDHLDVLEGFSLTYHVLSQSESSLARGGHARDQRHQDVVVNWFNQMMVESSVCSSPPIIGLSAPREGDENGLSTWRAPNALGSLVAVEDGKADVEQNNVRLEFRNRGHCLQSVVGRSDFMTDEFKQHGHHHR
jgi:hypothetical protein